MAARPIKNKRTKILEKAERAVNRDRESDYGPPSESLAKIAALWSGYKGIEFSSADVAAMLLLVKVARIAANPSHQDSWIDICGYGSLGGEVASKSP